MVANPMVVGPTHSPHKLGKLIDCDVAVSQQPKQNLWLPPAGQGNDKLMPVTSHDACMHT